MRSLVAVILAGGSGTRFWPLSTNQLPKQFLRLVGKRTMLQQTFDRLADLVPMERVLVVTNDRFLPIVREQLPDLPPENIIGEPVSRDTAAAIVLAAVVCRRLYGNATMLVLPADHVISPVVEFRRAVRSAASEAAKGPRLYTFGITPAYPATGYGYLKVGGFVGSVDGIDHYRLEGFKEKPSINLARQYINEPNYFWNSGIFIWELETFMAEIEAYLPEHARRLWPLAKVFGEPSWHSRLLRAFRMLPRISIDYGLMEKTAYGYMVKAPFAWSDVGNWAALKEFLPKDSAGNAFRGMIRSLEAERNLVFCENSDELVVMIGVRDLIIVRVGNRTLIVHRDKGEKLRDLVHELEA